MGDCNDTQQPLILSYASGRKRPIRKLVVRGLWVLGLCVIFVVLLRVAIYLIYPPIPFRNMWVVQHDRDGAACIESPAFTILYEGHSFGSHTSAGNWTIDGRYPSYSPLNDRAQLGSGGMGYSQRDRPFCVCYTAPQ